MHYFFLWGWVVCCVCCLGLVLVWVLVVCCVAAVVFVGVAGGLCEMVGDCVSAILFVAGGGEVLFWADLDEWVCVKWHITRKRKWKLIQANFSCKQTR
jgi:hypothetical protein